MIKLIRVNGLGRRLQGKAAGRKHFADICKQLANIKPGEVGLLDFGGVEIANGSWLNMTIAPLVRWAADEQVDAFPVLFRFPRTDLDELELVATINQHCYVVADGKQGNPLSSALVIGSLDDSLRTTLNEVYLRDGVTGAELARQVPTEKIQPTAWNNRLRDLYDLRLVRRRKDGRQQVYSPLAKEIRFNGR